MKTFAIQQVEPIEIRFADNFSYILRFNTKGFFKMTAEMNKSDNLKGLFFNLKDQMKNLNEETLQTLTTIVIKAFTAEKWTYEENVVIAKQEISLHMEEALTLATNIPIDCLIEILDSFSDNLTHMDKKKLETMKNLIKQ